MNTLVPAHSLYSARRLRVYYDPPMGSCIPEMLSDGKSPTLLLRIMACLSV